MISGQFLHEFSSVHIVGILTIPGQRTLNTKRINPLCELKVSPKQFLVSSSLQISKKSGCHGSLLSYLWQNVGRTLVSHV